MVLVVIGVVMVMVMMRIMWWHFLWFMEAVVVGHFSGDNDGVGRGNEDRGRSQPSHPLQRLHSPSRHPRTNFANQSDPLRYPWEPLNQGRHSVFYSIHFCSHVATPIVLYFSVFFYTHVISYWETGDYLTLQTMQVNGLLRKSKCF